MILLWGLPEEGPLAAVADALRTIGTPFLLLDQNRTEQIQLGLHFGRVLRGTIWYGDTAIDLRSVHAAYLRPYPNEHVPALACREADSPAWHHANALLEAIWTWAELTNALVINRPLAMASNNSKPFQAAMIRSAGFATPPTLITNRLPAVRHFQRTQGEIIYKSISSQRSIVSRLESRHAGRWRDLRWCPTQFQRLIPGVDVRVHVVGDELFACAIHAEAIDYRYASDSRHIERCELPDDCARRCRELARSLGLFVAGIDLRKTPSGEWFCFEVNPSPGFTFFVNGGKQEVAAAIAQALSNLKSPSKAQLEFVDQSAEMKAKDVLD